jgi:hypothetical protein
MRRRPMLTAVLAAVLLFCLASISGANWITYATSEGNQGRVMVMNDDGTGVTELFAGGKFSPIPAFPSISPLGHSDGTWITFNLYYDIYKIRPDGTEPTLVLCGAGADLAGNPYELLWGSEWSPTGSEILVYTHTGDPNYQTTLSLIPADHTAVQAEVCTSQLEPIYAPPDEYFSAELTASWSGDGNRIAVFEQDWLSEETHLLILGRPASANELWRRLDTIIPDPQFDESLEIRSQGLAWRPGSEFVVFPAAERVRRQTYLWLTGIDLDTGDWNYVLDNGNRVPLGGYAFPTWSSDGSQLVYADPGGNLVKWDYPDGEKVVIGSGDSADWQRDAFAMNCNVSGCDDGNPCTEDICDTNTGQCSFTGFADDTPCGIHGWCTSGFCFEPECGVLELPACSDGNLCTVDSCSNYECVFDAEAALGFACNDNEGCTSNDLCDGAGGCAGTFDPTIPGCSCVPKGDFCTSDAECCSGSCHPIKLTCK